ncbi:MAG: lycopene cyclase domain-containing protein [Nanoarchaeota archaeon]|nr:lycopene cyclase domain-containing protein [Nanoarchaeota archaeon]
MPVDINLSLYRLSLEYKFHIHLYKSRKERIIIPVIFLIIGSIWDSFAIWRGHWTFQGPGLIGVTIGFMPFEEYLFALIVPYFILTLYRVLKRGV